jgi:hypothetical protein
VEDIVYEAVELMRLAGDALEQAMALVEPLIVRE